MLLSASDWETFSSNYPNTHLLQSAAWGELKAAFGWEAARLRQGETGAQVLFRRLPLGFTLAYIPKGPLGISWDELLIDLDTLCRQKRAVFLKIEPDLWEEAESDSVDTSRETVERAVIASLRAHGFQPSFQPIQPRRTLIVDLRKDERALLAAMKQKTRYNIRLAQKKGVRVRPLSDFELFHRLMCLTGQRDGFGVHSLDYYRRAFELFQPSTSSSANACALLAAEYEGEILAALMVFARHQRAWYMYGASSDAHRNLMPSYLLQWEAMRWAKQRGCVEYDLWGVPDEDEAVLEAGFTECSDGLWGVYRFKRGFGGELRRSIGAWDKVYQPLLYLFYRFWMKRSGDG